MCAENGAVLSQRRFMQRRLGRLMQEADDGGNVLATKVILDEEAACADVGIIQRFAQRVHGREADIHSCKPGAPVLKRFGAENAPEELDHRSLMRARAT